MKVLDACGRWPGSSHDATIFAHSQLSENMDLGVYGNDSVILGDSAYAPKHYICKPLREPQSRIQRCYQYSQIKTRNVAERTYGLLKWRFPALQIGMHYNVAKVQDIIVACCIIHNMIQEEKAIEIGNDIQEIEREFQRDMSEQLAAVNQQRNRPMRIQDFLIENYFIHQVNENENEQQNQQEL